MSDANEAPQGSAEGWAGDEPTTQMPLWRKLARGLRRDKITAVALVILIVMVLFALMPGVFAPHDPLSQDLRLRNAPPMTPATDGGLPHVLGTDPLGRDLLSRLIHGAQVSLSVGVSGVVLSGVVGVLAGLAAGYRRGWLDDFVMRLVDLQMGIPFLVLALFILYAIGPGFLNVVLVLALMRWPLYARVARGLTMSLRETAFIEAAHSLGARTGRIVFRHVLPNLLSPLIVLATLELARMILAEATVSFLGLGIQPPEPSWGLIAEDGRGHMRSAWWIVTMPGLFILATALSANLLATWLRAITDPAQRWRWLAVGRQAVKEDPDAEGGPAELAQPGPSGTEERSR